jgi:hypothetical protein
VALVAGAAGRTAGAVCAIALDVWASKATAATSKLEIEILTMKIPFESVKVTEESVKVTEESLKVTEILYHTWTGRQSQ